MTGAGNDELHGALEVRPPILVGRVLMAHSRGGNADLSQILRQAAEAWREGSRNLVLCAVFEPRADFAVDDARDALLRTASSLLNYCEAIVLIVPGVDVGAALVRTALRGAARVSTTSKGIRIRVVESAAAALRLAGELGLPATDFERAIRAAESP